MENFGDLGPDFSIDDLYEQMYLRGWVTFPDDGSGGETSTVIFRICEDVRKVDRKRQYKKMFIKEQASRFLSQEEEDGQFYPCDAKVDEYREAVKELAANGC